MSITRQEHLDTPKPDTGRFSTSEVRSTETACLSTSRVVSLPKNHYKAPPRLAAGFSSLDISCEGPIRANIVANEITTSSFRIAVEAWGNCQLFEASTVWIEHKSNAKDCIFGQFDTRQAAASTKTSPKKPPLTKKTSSTSASNDARPKKYSRPCFFPKPFPEPPEIICWLNRINLASGPDYDYKLRAFANEATTDSFMAHLNTWDNGQLHGAAMCWIAFPKGKKHVDSGRFATADVRRRTNPRPRTTAVVKFRQKFPRVPTVLAALNMFDAAGNADLRVKLEISEVDREGFRWTFESWSDSTLYAASAHWIALGFG